MKVVVAIDSLKNSLTSVEAGRAIEAGVRKAYGGHPVQVIVKPLADGGEGTVEALVDGLNGELRYVGVQGPLGEAVSCPYGYLPGMEAAVIEMAGAAGLGLVPAEQRNPLVYDDVWCRPGHGAGHGSRHTPLHHRFGRQLDQ